jgi:hypothetical protein
MRISQHPKRVATLAVALCAVMGTGMLVWSASQAAFSAPTGNIGSSFSVATVALGDDDSGTAMFAVTNAQPGDSGQQCITVNFTGSAPSTVKLSATGLTGALGPYLSMTVEQGTGGSFAGCTGFVSQTSVSATLTSFAGTYTDFASGFGSWPSATAGSSRTYRISWSPAWDNAAANKWAALTFVWEARNN